MENKIKKIISGTILLVAILGAFIMSQPSSVNAATILDGDLIKNPNAAGELKNDVYIVKIVEEKRLKRLLLSPHVFESYGHLSWDQIKYVGESTMNQYTTSDLVRCYDPEKGIDDPKVYQLTHDGTKEWLDLTPQEFERQGYDWDAVYIINKTDRDAYRDEEEPEELLPVVPDPVFEALSQKIGQDDAKLVADYLAKVGFVLTEEFVDEFIIDHSPGYDADNDVTIIGDPEAPYFLEIAKNSLDRFYSYSPELYQYAMTSLRYIRGVNFGTRCGSARTTHDASGMERNTYIYIYDYEDTPLSKQPLISSFMFVHEATHNKNHKLEQSGQIRKLTGNENEATAYLAHAYYAKEYDFQDQGILNPSYGMTLKEFVMKWVFRCKEAPEGYFWDWDFYLTVLEKAGFPSGELEKLKAYLTVVSTTPVISNIQISKITSDLVIITWNTNKLANAKLEYSLNSDLSSATTTLYYDEGRFGTNHTDWLSNPSRGKTYYYRITATDVSGNSSVSSIHQISIP